MKIRTRPYENVLRDDNDSSFSEDSANDDDTDNSSSSEDVLSLMTEREDPEVHEYQQLFSTSSTGDDIVVPDTVL